MDHSPAETGQPQTFDNPRDWHLFSKHPKRLLALDGGGVRGAITVAFLEQIEKIIGEERRKPPLQEADDLRPPVEQAPDPPVRLGDWFDLVGGTSTGAIIAGALALGKTTKEIKDFYLRLAPRVFRRPLWRLPILQAKFDFHALSEEIRRIVQGETLESGKVQDETLDSGKLITGLAIIAKRMDTGSPWILANNKRAPFWDDAPSHIGNKHYKLAALVRASTAAPHYFDPEIISILETPPADPLEAVSAKLGRASWWLRFLLTRLRAKQVALSKAPPNPQTHGLFVDGGMTPYNNPVMGLVMMAVLRPFGICWPLGTENLTVVSIGTGSFRTRVSFADVGFTWPLRLAIGSLLSLMSDNQYLALAQMQWLGECLTHWEINSEIKTLCDEVPPGGHWFRFARYDVRLETKWLAENLDLDLTEREITRLRRMDDPGIIKCIYGIARLAAEMQVKREHFFPEPRQPLASEQA